MSKPFRKQIDPIPEDVGIPVVAKQKRQLPLERFPVPLNPRVSPATNFTTGFLCLRGGWSTKSESVPSSPIEKAEIDRFRLCGATNQNWWLPDVPKSTRWVGGCHPITSPNRLVSNQSEAEISSVLPRNWPIAVLSARRWKPKLLLSKKF